jgi:hypothetical protein
LRLEAIALYGCGIVVVGAKLAQDAGVKHVEAIMNRVAVEQIIRDEKQVRFEPGDTYLLSYPEFVAYFANLDEITRHNLIIAANFIYGWMPRTLRFRSQGFASAVAILNAVKRGSPIGQPELCLLQSLIDNSMVAVSKLLHFIRPDLHVIWDRRVYTYVNENYNQAEIQKPGNYLAFLDNCRGITRDGRFEAVHASMNQKIGYEVSPLRALELVMYWTGGS